MIYLVTGGRGFIGSHFVERVLRENHTVVDIDKMTYAASATLPWDQNPNYTHIKEDICNLDHLPNCDVIVNFAAESCRQFYRITKSFSKIKHGWCI